MAEGCTVLHRSIPCGNLSHYGPTALQQSEAVTAWRDFGALRVFGGGVGLESCAEFFGPYVQLAAYA